MKIIFFLKFSARRLPQRPNDISATVVLVTSLVTTLRLGTS